jgi:hypothetical protein
MATDFGNTQLKALAERVEAARAQARRVAGGLSKAQLDWQPGPGRWGVGQCLEHLIVCSERLAPSVRGQLAALKARIASPMTRLISYHLGDALTIAVVHLPRHLDQAAQVRAEPGFPEG